MGLGDKLKIISDYVRERWRSTDPNSYDQYRLGREHDRNETAHSREDVARHRDQERNEAERGREYEERYTAEGLAAEPGSKEPRGESGHPSDGSGSV
jgi:hypothetical protein